MIQRMVALTMLAPCLLSASDWPQFRGPHRDNAAVDEKLTAPWPKEGPPLVWVVRSLGTGHAGPAVVGKRIYISGQREGSQWLMCLDAADGRELWACRLGESYTNEFGDGPRGTPTVIGDVILVMGANGELLCASLADGTKRWSVDMAQFGGVVPGWGYSEGPLVDDGRVYVTPGGARGGVIALDLATGSLIWQSDYPITETQYTSLMLRLRNGRKELVCLDRENITGLSLEGKTLWQEEFRSGVVVAQMPVVSGDLVYATAAGGRGSKAVRVNESNQVEVLYANKIMKNLPGGVVHFEGHVYGYSDARGWVCQQLETGQAVWEHESSNTSKGTLTIAGGKLLCVEEASGIILLAEASPSGWKEWSRFTPSPASTYRAQKGKVWSVPVVSRGRLYHRDQELLFSFQVGP